MRFTVIFSVLVMLGACASLQPLPTTTTASWKTKVIPPSPQPLDGDATAGLDYLINGDYLGSGIPLDFFARQIGKTTDTLFYRNGVNGQVDYTMTAFEAPNGVKVINGNCFTCHAGQVLDQVVVGMGNSFSDYRTSFAPMAKVANFGVRTRYKKDSPEYAAFDDFGNYFRKMAPAIETNQPGANPAFRLAEACMAHRDPVDLTFVEEAQWELYPYNLATDTPPLWHAKKKNSLYYAGVGRGDFSKLLFQASVLGIPDSSAARKAVTNFEDVVAWLHSLEAPVYPGLVDDHLAKAGKKLFTEHCSGCHGTYGATETYPNKVVHLDVVKTDTMYAHYIQNSGIVDWYNRSWFATSEPKSWFEPELGYVAPPLDGIWATAPYLHNGSVPTLEELLDSAQRPVYWERSGDPMDYDHQKVGWNYERRTNARGKWTFDTTLPGYANVGHYFGDKLTATERNQVIEYLKTL